MNELFFRNKILYLNVLSCTLSRIKTFRLYLHAEKCIVHLCWEADLRQLFSSFDVHVSRAMEPVCQQETSIAAGTGDSWQLRGDGAIGRCRRPRARHAQSLLNQPPITRTAAAVSATIKRRLMAGKHRPAALAQHQLGAKISTTPAVPFNFIHRLQ